MKALLDNEMPDKGAILLVPKQKEQKRFLLLLPLLLLTTMAALFFYYQHHITIFDEAAMSSNSTSEVAIFSQKENKFTEYIIASDSVLDEASLENVQTINDFSETLVANSVDVSKSNKKVQILNSNLEKQNVKSVNQNESEVVKTPFENKAEIEKETKPLSSIISVDEKPYEYLKELKKEEVKEEFRKPIASVKAIEGNLLNLLVLKEEKTTLEKFLNIEKQKNSLPIYGFVGIRNYDFSDNIDLVVGVETILRKEKNKFGLRTGLNYAQRSTTYLTKEEEIAMVNFDTADEEFALGGGANLYYEARLQLNSSSIKYHFL
jgi:hypothetical protein